VGILATTSFFAVEADLMRSDLLDLELLYLVIWLDGELELVELAELELLTSWFPS
jgi:hypothetical protein